MNVGLTMHEYQLPLVCPLRLAEIEVSERDGWIIELTGPNGNRGYGEIAPLPGLSPESELAMLADWDGERVEPHLISPAVSCGLDMAFWNLGDPELIPSRLRTLPPPRDQLEVSALLIGEVDQMLQQQRAAAREGYPTVKIKLGRLDPAAEVEMLNTINRYAHAETRFRLDANRAWTPDDAEAYLGVLSEMNVEYVEEPFANPRASLAWSDGTGVPVAFDESLNEISPAELAEYPNLRAIVLKPSLLGGLSRCMEYIDVAREMETYPVISAMLESGVGTITLARFAASVCDPDTATGLDTYRWLADDVLEPRPQLTGGWIAAAEWDWSRYRVRLD